MPKKRLNYFEKGYAHLFLVIGVAALIGLFISSRVTITSEYQKNDPNNVKGVLIAKGGDDGGSSGSGSSGSESSGSSGSDTGSSASGSSDSSGSSRSGSSGSSGGSSGSSNSEGSSGSSSSGNSSGSTAASPQPTSSSVKTRTTSPTGVQIRTETSDKREETELRFSDDEKVKTRIEDGRSRIDVYQGGIKVRYEVRDGRVIVKAETEEGEGVPDQELFKIEDRLDKSGIKVATDGGKLLIARNSVGAVSNFPLQVNLETNQLIASTAAGTKVLTVLPDQAVQNMLAANVISKLVPSTIVEQAQQGELTSVSDIVNLGERNGVAVYEINGLKENRLLGIIPVNLEKKVFVSAESGEVVATQQSLLATVIEALSP